MAAAAVTRDVTDGWRKISDAEIVHMHGLLESVVEESQDTVLLKKERRAFDAVEELAAKRLSVNVRLKECRQKKKMLERKQDDLRKMALDNAQVMKDMDRKIEMHEKKAREETLECKRLDEELEFIEAQFKEKQVAKQKLGKDIESSAHFKRLFDQTVRQYEEQFEGDIENIIKREHALRASSTELRENNQKLQNRLESLREKWLADQAQLQNDQLIANSRMHEGQINQEACRGELSEVENKLRNAREEKEQKESTYGVMKFAIEELLQRTLASCRLPQRKKAMLDFVDAPIEQPRYRTDLSLMAISERLEELMWLKQKSVEEEAAQVETSANAHVHKSIMKPNDVEFQIPALSKYG